jgi:vacuolar-type H+-ATPase subunit I/STV1
MKTKVALIILVVLLAGATIFYAHRAGNFYQQLQQAAPPPVATTPAPPPNLETSRLRKLLNEREIAYAQLAATYRQLAKAQSTTQQQFAAPATSVVVTAAATSTTSRRAWVDSLKQDDPVRYKQIVAERDQRRKAMEQWFHDRVTALDQRAQSAPTQAEAELATQIADNLTKLNDLRQQWQSLRGLPDDEREVAIQQLHAESRDVYQNLRTLSQQDRQLQLQQLAQSAGYTSASDIQKFITAVGDIYQSTDYAPHRMGFGGGGHNRDAAPQPAVQPR